MKIPALALIAATLAAPGYGQVAEFWFGGGLSRLSNNGIGSFTTTGSENDVKLEDGFRLNFLRMTFNQRRFLGHEFGYAYNRTQLNLSGTKTGMAIHQGFYTALLYATPEGSRVRPFAAGGGHFSNFVPPGSSVTQGGGQTKFGFHYGGGLKVRISEIFGLRADFRQYNTGKPFDLPLATGRLRQNEISVSFGLLL
jgi:opacity protein-like surface antigen